MKTIKPNFLILLACLAVSVPADHTAAQVEATLEEQIRAAVEAEGDAYFELREKIFRQGEAARTALQTATQWDRPEARVIAQAMLKWMDEENREAIIRRSETLFVQTPVLERHQITEEIQQQLAFRHCYVKIHEKVCRAMRAVGGWESGMLSGFNSYARGEADGAQKYWPKDPYLLELALKSYPPEFLKNWGRGISRTDNNTLSYHRMCAAAAAGVSPCTNTVAVLTLLLDVKYSPRIRQGALAGLAAIWVRASKAAGGGIPEDLRCLPTFDKALDDPDREVRLQAYGFLTLLTEGNLGIDLVGRSRNLSPEDVQFIREHLAKWQAEEKKKTKGDAAPVEQEGKNESTPTPAPETTPSP